MSERPPADLESLLRAAFRPVEPPEELAVRVETTLVNLTELAADELEAWELASVRDPRTWVRPAAAALIGTTAGAALIVVRARQRGKRHRSGLAGAAESAARDAAGVARDVADEARRLARGATRGR